IDIKQRNNQANQRACGYTYPKLDTGFFKRVTWTIYYLNERGIISVIDFGNLQVFYNFFKYSDRGLYIYLTASGFYRSTLQQRVWIGHLILNPRIPFDRLIQNVSNTIGLVLQDR